jgi:hypothetical protein
MKKSISITAAVLLACALVFYAAGIFAEDAQPAPAGAESSSDVVVKGQLKIKIEAAKPEIPVKTDANEVAEQVVKTEDVFMALAPEDIKDIRLGLPETISEDRPEYRADLFSLETQPIFKIQPKMPAGVEIEKWSFKVNDPTGAVVKSEKGTGAIPDRLIWDGFDQNGQILKLNAPYMYTLTYMDKAGNPGSTKRKEPKVVQAIKYYRDGKLYIEVCSSLMFEKERKDRVTDKGKELLKEVEDYIKMSNTFPIEIQIYADDAGLAKDQADTLKIMFDKSLKLPKSSYNMKAIKDVSVPRNFRLVFILKG